MVPGVAGVGVVSPAGAAAAEREAVPAATPAWAWLVPILVLGAVLRAVRLGEGLWYDEITTLVNYAAQPLGRIVTTFDSQNQHLLFSVLARLSILAFGESAAALRLPAAAAGVLSLGLVAWFGAKVGSRREALLAALLLAASYHHVWFSQNARGYTLLLCGALAGTGFLLDTLEQSGLRARRAVAWYGVTMALAVYTHVTAVFLVAGHAVVWLALLLLQRLEGPARWRPVAAFGLAGALSLVVYAPVLGQIVETVTRPTMAGTTVEWRNPLWFVTETARGLIAGVPGGVAGLAAGLVVAGTGLVGFARRRGAALALMLVPVGVTAAAMLATAHNLWPRLFFFAAGFGALIAVRGGFALLERLMPARAALVGTLGVVTVSLASVATVPRAWRPKQDFAAARAFVVAAANPGDAIVTVDMTRFPYQRWLRTDWPAVDSDTALAEVEGRHVRTWVLVTFPTRLAAVYPALWARLERDYTEAARFPGTVGGGAVIVKVRS